MLHRVSTYRGVKCLYFLKYWFAVCLLGVVLQAQTLSFSPAAVNFGDQKVLTLSQPQYIYISNQGTESVSISSLAITGPNASDFTAGNYCDGSISAGASCSVFVEFEPSAMGSRTASLIFTDSASGSPQSVALSGTGQGEVLSLQVAPSSLSFQAQIVGSTSQSQSVNVQNLGNSSVSFSSISISGTNASDFALVSNNCAPSLPTGPFSTCALSLVFTPSAAGNRTATLTIVDNATGSPQTVALSGTGQLSSSAILSVSPSSANFGTQILGTTTNISLFVANQGNVPVSFSSVAISGANAGDFTLSQNGCEGSLGGGYTCQIGINFSPGGVGARSATLNLVDSASGSPQAYALTGTGQASVATLSISPTAVTFPSTPVGQATSNAIVLSNTGNETIIISTKAGGANPGDFSAQSPCTYISPGQFCFLFVTFSPTAAGPRSSTWTLTDNAIGSPQTIQLSGTGTASASLSFSPAALNFGKVNLGATASETVTITNTSNVASSFGAPTSLAGGDSGDFSIASTTCPTFGTLAGGASCSITISFSPTEPGPRSTTLQLSDTAYPSPQVLFVGGNGAAVSKTLAFSTLLVPFGSQPTGSTSSSASVVATNTGNMAVDLGSITVAGTNAADFSITSGACNPGNINTASSNILVPGATCAVTLTFAPTASGSRSASLVFTGDQVGSPQSIKLTGIGSVPGASLALSIPELAFGRQAVGSTASEQTVAVENVGNVAVNLNSYSIQGADAADFAVSNSFLLYGPQLQPGGSGSFSILFTPSAAGTRTATLSISNSASATPLTVPLTGTGLAESNMLTIDNTVNFFGAQTVGTSGLQFTATLQNSGSSNIDLDSFNITGPAASDFTITFNFCSLYYSSLPPGQNCQVTLAFNPTAAGLRTATLNVVSSAANTPLTVAMNGYGVKSSANPISVFPSTLNFSTALGVGVSQIVTLVNTGSDPVAVTPAILGAPDFSYGGVYCGNNFYNTVPAGSSCSVYVTYTPSGLGSRTASLSFGNVAVSLKGTAQSPLAAVSTPASVTFNSQGVGLTSLPLAIQIKDTGNEPITLSSFAISGTNSADFSMEANTCPGSLQPGQICTVAVTFTPTAKGARTASLVITDNVTGSPQMVTLKGTGEASQSNISFSTLGLSFGPTNLAATGSLPLVITNTGSTTVTFSTYKLGGANSGDFSISENICSSTFSNSLLAGATCTITLAFKPTAAGVRMASLQIADTASGSPQTVLIDGLGQSLSGTLVLSSVAVDFGGISVASHAVQAVSIYNTGDVAVPFTGFTITGPNATDFKLSSNTCNVAGVPAQSTCIATLTFTPLAAGLRTASLTLNGGSSPQSVALVGLGEAAAKSLAVAVPLYDFGVSNVGATVASAPLSILNTGTAGVTFSGYTISGANAADFSITANTCTTQLNVLQAGPGSICSITVTFKPAAAGVRNALLTLADDASGSPQTISLTGIGQSVKKSVILSPAAFDFGVSDVGTSVYNSFFVINSGTAPVTISKIAISGTNAADFAISSNYCSNAIPVGVNCSVYVSFTPSAAGIRTAVLSFTDDAGTGVQTATLTGNGIRINPKVTVSQTTVPITSVIGIPAQNSVVFTNVGTGPASFTTPTLSGTNAADFSLNSSYCPATSITPGELPAGQSCAVTVTFTPTIAGTETATLSLTAGTAVTINLVGLGQTLQEAVLFSTNFELFAGQNGSSGGSQTVFLTSIGTAPVAFSSASITGTDASSFSLDSYQGCVAGSTISSNPYGCGVNVDFTPGTSPFSTATLQITDSASSAVQSVLLSGVSEVSGQSLVGVPTSFPESPVGVATVSQTVYFTNYGSTNLTLNSPQIVGADAADYSISSNSCGSSLNSYQSCAVNVIFKPAAGGVRVAALLIDYSGGTGTAAYAPLGGNGTSGKGYLVVNSLGLEFNATIVNTTNSNVGSLQLTNTGTGDITFGTFAFSGRNGGDFTVQPDSQSASVCGATLAPESQCTLLVQFTPSATGLRTGILQINSNASNAAPKVALAGVGQAATEILYSSQSSIDLGVQSVNAGSSTAYLSLESGGNTNINLSGIQITGTNASDFSITSTNCGTQLAGSACNIGISFTPTATGPRSSVLSISSDASSSPFTIPLSGLGQPASMALTLDHATIDFGPGSVSTLSTATIYVTNQGTSSVSFSVPVITGTNAADFSITSNTCGLLTNGNNCAISIAFVPSAVGERTATLTIKDDATASPQIIPLYGTGESISYLLAASTNALNMGSQSDGLLSANTAVQISNTGTSPVTLSGITITGTNAADFILAAPASGSCAASIPSGTMCSINVQFLPSIVGPETATLTVTSNSSAGPLLISLFGDGQKATVKLSASTTELNLGDVDAGNYTTSSVTLTNDGNTNVGIAPLITGSAAQNFYVEFGTCTGALAPKASCALSVSFVPNTTGISTATLQIYNTASSTPLTITLAGLGN